MTAPLEVWPQDGRTLHETLSALQVETLRGRLLDGIGEWSARFAQDAAIFAKLTANSSADSTGLDRALAALHKYDAIDAIDKLHDALSSASKMAATEPASRATSRSRSSVST